MIAPLPFSKEASDAFANLKLALCAVMLRERIHVLT